LGRCFGIEIPDTNDHWSPPRCWEAGSCDSDLLIASKRSWFQWQVIYVCKTNAIIMLKEIKYWISKHIPFE
jgi:hypothetical protein